MKTFLFHQHNSHVIDKKTRAMTSQIRGMARVLRDNRESMLDHPQEVADLAMASMQLAQMAKWMLEDCR